jgi:acetyl-CoA acetyltransferase family protein
MATLSLPPLAVLAGIRTPFAKAFGPLASVPADALGRIALQGALARAGLAPTDVGEVVFGNVAGQADASNIARVIALRSGVPQDRIAHTVNRNCASGVESIVSAWHILAEGRADLVVAGGTESMSNVPLLYSNRARDFFFDLRRKGFWGRLGMFFSRLRPSLFKPIPALELGLSDPTCGLNMGQTAEVLAKEFGIGREEQDRFALASHQKAVTAWKRGFFTDEVVPVPADVTGRESVALDTGPRPNQTMEALAKLPTIFDRKTGSEQLPDHRWCGRGGADTGGATWGPCATRLRPRLRHRRVRPATHGPRPGVRGPQVAEEDRPAARGLRPR